MVRPSPPWPSPLAASAAVAVKEFNVRMLRAVAGSCDDRQANYLLTDDLQKHLHGTEHVVVVDEAHNLSVKRLQQLRYLHQQGEFTWTLILVGVTIAEALFTASELRTRTEGLVLFSPLTGAELLVTLKQMHPLFASSSNDALRYVDSQYPQGCLREWARFLRIAKELAPKLKTTHLNDKLIAAGLAAVGADAWQQARR